METDCTITSLLLMEDFTPMALIVTGERAVKAPVYLMEDVVGVEPSVV